MQKIHPNCTITARRLRFLIASVYDKYLALNEDQRTPYLNLGVDFDYLCDTLSAYGITRSTIHSPPQDFRGVSISNLTIVELEKARKELGLSPALTRQWVINLACNADEFFNVSRLDYAIKKLMDSYCKLSSSKAVHDFVSKSDKEIIRRCLKAMCSEALDVTRRQLSDFLP
ncbi:hypothetical protein PoB_005999800 [Plakobranchus ocellatus]|uniref:Uncharacterized protein n=1 Tax=Plakobranchus ocellatus TaxID=259542 RepID=A0AAV4CNL8_9GAST|nr:hypothetical protein PoB_005999800 [Plakobranchus ocellatus]